MPRDPKPWFRKDRDAWFVTINGRRFNLGPDRAAAHDRFHELMLTGGEGDTSNGAVTVFGLFDDFLEWTKAQRAPRTYEWYRDFLEAFSAFLKVDRSALRLKPVDVLRWVAKHPQWSLAYQRDCIRSIQRPFRWAHRVGLIDRNPIQFIDKPPAQRREQIVTVEEYPNVLANIRSARFKDLVTAAWETGARPQELTRVEVRHVDLRNSRWVFPPNEAKVKNRHRIIYLNPEALRLTREALERVSEGPLFRNRAGRPWNAWAINCQFTRLKERIGRRLCLYVFRHSFATRMLMAGVDPMTVATLLGHADASMLGKVYQHLAQCPQHLLDQLNRVSQPASNGDQ
jgi:integrase